MCYTLDIDLILSMVWKVDNFSERKKEFMDRVVKVLAVADPAVSVYVDKKFKILDKFDGDVQFDVVPWAKYYSTMMDVFAGKAFYDVIMVAGHLWLRDFVESGYLIPIEFEEEDILPGIVQEIKYKEFTYLSPSFCDGHMIVYRKKILQEKYGKLFDEVITPHEYIQAAINVAYNDQMAAVAMKAHQSEIFTDALPFLRMGGQDVYDKNTFKVNCNNSNVINGLKSYCVMKKLAPKDTDTYGNEEIAEAIQKKKAAMAVTWSGQLGVVYNEDCEDKEDLGFATFDTAWNVTWSFAISSNSKNIEKANELLRYLRSPEVDLIAGAHSGAPVRRNSYTDGMNKYPWYSCQLRMLENAQPIPCIKSAGDKNGILYEEIANAFTGAKPPELAMEDAERKINEIDDRKQN